LVERPDAVDVELKWLTAGPLLTTRIGKRKTPKIAVKISVPFKEPAQLLMHLNSGFTKVILLGTKGQGLADGGVTWEIPTEVIPAHLRPVGSRFIVVAPRFTPEVSDSAETIREMCRQIQIEEMSDDVNPK